MKREPGEPSPRPHLEEERKDSERLQPLGAPCEWGAPRGGQVLGAGELASGWPWVAGKVPQSVLRWAQADRGR